MTRSLPNIDFPEGFYSWYNEKHWSNETQTIRLIDDVLHIFLHVQFYIWDKVFKSGLSKFCGRQHLKNLKAVFHKIYLVHSWILCPIYSSTYAAEKALPHKQKILLIWDSFKTQSTTKLEETYASYGIETVMVPKNMTHLL